jgi:glycosyltransferase involved in cell wall biosynthesis
LEYSRIPGHSGRGLRGRKHCPHPPGKGQQYLLQAAQIVIGCWPNTTFLIVGRAKPPEARQELEAQAADLGIKDKIIFTGFREDALRIIAACDLFVLSSLFEGLPVALLEAMAQGKPPVVTAVGGIPGVVTDGVEGFLVEPKDYHTLAQRIITLLQDADLRSQMSVRASRKIEEKFSLHRMVCDVESVYARTLSGS